MGAEEALGWEEVLSVSTPDHDGGSYPGLTRFGLVQPWAGLDIPFRIELRTVIALNAGVVG